MKKFLSILLSMCMVLSLSIPVYAATEEDASAHNSIAYMDIYTAPENMINSILEARAEIIYGDQAWTVNGAVKKVNADGTKEALPEFSDLFPDWDIPTISTTHANTNSVQVNSAKSSIDYKGNVDLKVASSTETSEAFYYFNGLGTEVHAYAETLPGDRYNLGYTNEDTSQSVGWCPNIKVGEDNGYTFDAEDNIRYSVRASVFEEDDEGWASMVVEDLG